MEDRRSSNRSYTGGLTTPGPYLAKVVNNIDPMRQGALEVELLRQVGNRNSADQEVFSVRYCSPFYGVTDVRNNGNDGANFNHTQKSYGFWAVPPDTGTLVMVIFVDSDPGQGYWFGCVQDSYMNHMIPGIAGTKSLQDSALENDTESWKDKKSTKSLFDSEFLPAGEYNRKAIGTVNPDIDANKKPVHPIADRINAQGLIKDTTRGVHTSSARRETPSAVYGMSTPGPIDKRKNAHKASIGKADDKVTRFTSRLGGTQLVMDDGDETKLRKGKPWEEPMEYVDLEKESGGLVDFPADESFRIRTRTGHQILMHNAEDLIYITNARGTAWIELTSNGKIDIYAKDSISMRTEQDFNFVASRDFNIHAGRAVNMFAVNTTTVTSGNDVNISSKTASNVSSEGPMNLGGNGKLTFSGQIDNFEITTKSFKVSADSIDITSGKDVMITAGANIELLASASLLATASEQMHIIAGSNVNMQQKTLNILSYSDNRISSVAGVLHLKGGAGITASGAPMHLNGPEATVADEAREARQAIPANPNQGGAAHTQGQGGGVGGSLMLFPLPGVGQVIVKRAPTAEPYRHHENMNPVGFTPDLTDRENPSMPYAKDDPQIEIRNSDDADNVSAELGGNQGYDGDKREGAAGGGGGNVATQESFAPKSDQSYNERVNEGLLAKMPKDWASDKEFLAKVQELASSLNADFIDLLTLMMFETAWTMSPSKWNGMGYVGLIQFGKSAAKTIGTTTGDLSQMTRVQQIQYVKKYYEYWVKEQKISGKLTLAQLYILVAYPAYSSFPATKPIAERGGPRSTMWQNNPGWRDPPGKDSNGPITRESIGQAPRRCRPYVIAQLEKAGYSTGKTGDTPAQSNRPPT